MLQSKPRSVRFILSTSGKLRCTIFFLFLTWHSLAPVRQLSKYPVLKRILPAEFVQNTGPLGNDIAPIQDW